MADRPTGTVTFLFTDIEGSTRLWEAHPSQMQAALARHDEILRSAIERNGGYLFSTGGDGFAVAFQSAGGAVDAAIEAQSALESEDWPKQAPIRVRMGLHAGEAQERGGDYFGPTVNRAARVMSAGHGGQVLCSTVVRDLVGGPGRRDLSFDDLGSHLLKDLQKPERLLQLSYRGLPSQFAAPRSVDVTTSRLPAMSTALVGRERELAEVGGRLGSAGVVTLTGPGGVGKTRFAVELARERQESFPGGAWYVALAPLRDPASVLGAVATALGVEVGQGGELMARIVATLGSRPRLIVLDNCEHLIDTVAALVGRIGEGAPATGLVVTSREPLGVPGEQVVGLGPLSEGDAVQLLVQRAASVGAPIGDDDADRSALIKICRRLDGIPLAVELVAGWASSLSLGELADRLDQILDVPDPGRARIDRQQTMAATVDWSYRLLSEDAQRAFQQMSVFTGGFTVAGAEAVCDSEGSAVVAVVRELTTKSMVQVVGRGRVGRYRLLEPVREIAAALLDEDAVAARRARRNHADFYRAVVDRLAPALTSPARDDALDEFDTEADNLRSALGRLIDDHQARAAMIMAHGMEWYWYHRGLFREGKRHLETSVALSSDPDLAAERARCGVAAARLSFYAGDADEARTIADEALRLTAQAGDQRDLAYAHQVVALAAQGQLDPAALDAARRSVEAFRDLDDDWGTAFALFYLGVSGVFLGKPELASEALSSSSNIYEALGDDWGTGGARFYLGVLAERRGDHQQAIDNIELAVTLLRNSGDTWRQIHALDTLSRLVRADGHDSTDIDTELTELRTKLGLG